MHVAKAPARIGRRLRLADLCSMSPLERGNRIRAAGKTRLGDRHYRTHARTSSLAGISQKVCSTSQQETPPQNLSRLKINPLIWLPVAWHGITLIMARGRYVKRTRCARPVAFLHLLTTSPRKSEIRGNLQSVRANTRPLSQVRWFASQIDNGHRRCRSDYRILASTDHEI